MSGLDLTALGRRLKAAREHTMMLQTEVARLLGVTPAALSQYEAGKRKIDALALDKLARLYGVPVSFFFQDRSEEMPDWEASLRELSRELSPAGKTGVSLIVERLHTLEELHDLTGTSMPGLPHPPFRALPERELADYQTHDLAEDARAHYSLGKAPIRDMRGFLEANGYLVFTIPMGTDWRSDLSGMYFPHPQLGLVVVINENQAYTRWPFTLAHEFAHGLYHHDRPAILCRWQDARPLEDFANTFAGHFLVPAQALHEQLERLGSKTIRHPEEVVTLSRHFGISFRGMARRLQDANRLQLSKAELNSVKPVTLAKTLGFRTSPYEFGMRPLPIEERFPQRFLRLAYQSVLDRKLSLRRVAELLGVSHLDVEDRLYPTEPEEETEEPVGRTA